MVEREGKLQIRAFKFVSIFKHSPLSSPLLLCRQIVGNGSEQQLQRELEDVLMDPSVADAGLMDTAGGGGGGDHGLLPCTPGSDPLSATSAPPKLEIALPVQTAQESELNERSYRGEKNIPIAISLI